MKKRPKRPFRTISYEFFMIIYEKRSFKAVSYDFVRIFHDNSWKEVVQGRFVRFRTNFSWKFMKKGPFKAVSYISYDFFDFLRKSNFDQPKKWQYANNSWFIKKTIIFTGTGEVFAKNYSKEVFSNYNYNYNLI